MKVGFTGTRDGMTSHQKIEVARFLSNKKPEICIHGDCIGADKEFHNIAIAFGAKIEIHPPADSKNRAFCKADFYKDPLPYLDRNHNIVDSCDLIIAAPKYDYEELRSGTWATIRYAKRKNKKLMIIYPRIQTEKHE